MKTQTDSRQYEGQCKFCRQDFAKKQIIAHLDHCEERKNDGHSRLLRLRIVDPYAKNFWLRVEANNKATLKDLDALIRNVWVECCGHLSQFGNYGNELGKTRNIVDTLHPGDSIAYTYDFGSSTELLVEALAYGSAALTDNKKIELVARNYLPPSPCAKCGQQATQVCAACVAEEGMALACGDCAEKYHNEENEDEEHYILPLANSPRSGVCGYEPSGPLDKLF